MSERKHLRPRPHLHWPLSIAGLAVMRLELPAGDGATEHGHDVLEIAWIERGTLMHHIGPETVVGPPGSLLIVPVGCNHAYQVKDGSAVLWNLVIDRACAAIPTLPPPLSAHLPTLIPAAGARPALVLNVDALAPLTGILAEQEHQAQAWVPAAIAHLRLLLIAAARAIGDGRLQLLAHGDARINAICQHIDANPEKNWDLPTLAAATGLSIAGLVRAFRRTTGHTPGAYVRQARLRIARTLITDGASLATTATACGYGSAAALARATRRATGFTAGSWRDRKLQ